MTRRLFTYLFTNLARFPLAIAGMLFGIITISLCDLAKPFLASRFVEVIAKSISQDRQGSIVLSAHSLSIIQWSFVLIVGSYCLSALAWTLSEISLLSFLQKMRIQCLQDATFHLYHFSHKFFQNNLTGSIVSRLGDLFQHPPLLCITIFFDGIHFFFSLLFSLIFLWSVSPLYSVLIFGYSLAFLCVVALRIKTMHQLIQNTAIHKAQLIGQVSDYISNIFAVRSFARQKEEKARFKNKSDQYLKVALKHGYYILQTYALVNCVTIVYTALFIYFLTHQALSGVITAGDFSLVFMTNFNFGFLLYRIAMVSRQFLQDSSTLDKALQLLEEETPDMQQLAAIPQHTCSQLSPPVIQFENIYFSHATTKQNNTFALELSFSIQPGEKIGLVGYSGGGKSTITHLLQRLYQPQQGKILWNNTAIDQISLESLRENISFVPQDPTLFHRSIVENIRYGSPQATDDELIEAVKKAQIYEFIEQVGYETVVGERGLKLSGGQRQRIALARAFLKKAPLLILDEATSQLDSCTEKSLQESLALLMENKTTIVIAHRLSTLMQMDRLFVVSQGKIIQQGQHQDLVQENGLYRELWLAQVGGFIPTR